MKNPMDLHMHTIASDGADTPAQLLTKIMAAGIRVFSVTDHDTIEGALEMEKLVPPELRYIRGVEFSCIHPAGKCHILGYGYDPEDPELQAALELGRQLRQEKLQRRLIFLQDRFGITLTKAEEQFLYSQKSPGKPHLGQILLDRGLAPDVTAAIQEYINPCKDGNDRIDADLAIRAIRHAGGTAVWAHPLGGEGEDRLSKAEFQVQLDILAAMGIQGLECHYSRYTREDADYLCHQAARRNLIITAGSDYHGGNKQNLALGQLNAENVPVLDLTMPNF
jgi:predicted metal-dependent phosphoesterase TrpH